jgi:hypothetical protein
VYLLEHPGFSDNASPQFRLLRLVICRLEMGEGDSKVTGLTIDIAMISERLLNG